VIGVACADDEKVFVAEFFELFKTPWEPLAEAASYDVIVMTGDRSTTATARLIVVFEPAASSAPPVAAVSCEEGAICSGRFVHDGCEVPVYGSFAPVSEEGRALLRSAPDRAAIAVLRGGGASRVIRVGYNLFTEIRELLTQGQPPEYASVPTLDIHIALLRRWILDAGLPLVEIPPIPADHTHFACLTHDVDFIGIRRHWCDATMFGFLRRATLDTLRDCATGRAPLSHLVKNGLALAALPFIYLGLCRDFWDVLDQYRLLEGKHASTFFLIPFRNRVGRRVNRPNARRRAAGYDITDIGATARRLLADGCEIGVHGIDAWNDAESAREELRRSRESAGPGVTGMRVHWLCWDKASASVLDSAGYSYDSTFGYNKTVGLRAGTFQPFRPPGAATLLELPMHLQDVSLFARGYLHLSHRAAWKRFVHLQSLASTHGGAMTVLWHERSLGPERHLGAFYARMLQCFEQRGARIATAARVVQWFRARRRIQVQEVRYAQQELRVGLAHVAPGTDPAFRLRVHLPSSGDARGEGDAFPATVVDLPFSHSLRFQMSLRRSA
jgi:hypothetical protein